MTAPQIKKLRLKMNLTQIEFAKKLGVSRRTMQGWEAQKSQHGPSPLAKSVLESLKSAVEIEEEMPV